MNNNNLSYDVDIVFCIDCTESMDNVLNIVKERALTFHRDLCDKMQEKGKAIDSLRVRVVAFRDYLAWDEERRKGHFCNEPMLVTDFFPLPEAAEQFQISVRSLQPRGGGDIPEDGLEALAYAIRSDWSKAAGSKRRNVIVLWTDSEPHELGFGAASERYPKNMVRDLRELTAWWNENNWDNLSRRLVMFAPNTGAWNVLSDFWDFVILHPSQAGQGLRELDYKIILDCISQSI